MEHEEPAPAGDGDETDLRDNPADEQDPGSHEASRPPGSEEPGEGKIHDV